MTTGHAYTLIPESLSWMEAKTQAESTLLDGQAGYLATFTSKDEQNWTLQNLGIAQGDYFWIGAYQESDGEEPGGGWRWVTDEPWDFTFWFSGEPNESNPHEDYVNIHPSDGGFWNDAADTNRAPAIVEFGTNPIPTPTPGPTPGPTPNPASRNRGLRFDGANDYIRIPANPSLDLKGPLALAAWVRMDDPDLGQIIWRGDLQGGMDPYQLQANDGRMKFEVDTSYSQGWAVYSQRPIDHNYHFWVGVWDKDAGRLLLYRDGDLESSASISASISYSTSHMWTMIGAVDVGDWQHFRGEVDEARIYNFALTQEQVRRTMRRNLSGNEPGLVAHWNFNEGAGDQDILDASPNHNHAYLGSGAASDGADALRIDSGVPMLIGPINRNYEVDLLQSNRFLYLDRAYTFREPLPLWLIGQPYMVTRNDEKNINGPNDFLNFETDAPCAVFVLWDARRSCPSWLADWRTEDWKIGNTDSSTERIVFSKRFPTSPILLGPNREPSQQETSQVSMYGVIIVPASYMPLSAGEWTTYQ